MDKILKFIWLTQMGISPPKLKELFNFFGSVENIYLSQNYDMFYKLRQKDKDMLMNKSLDDAYAILERCKECGARVLTYDDELYPEALKHIDSPPYVLYIKGRNIDLNKEFCIGVVGTRYSTSYGGNITAAFCSEMAKRGIMVVSGMARGIDSVAAYATLKAGGETVAVLGCGIDIVYPLENKTLYQNIEKRGMLISEYPPGVRGATWTFPRRNRIIAGLSRGVIVIEGSEKSGSMITARFAEEFNRDVFAVPRNIDEGTLGGTNALIKEGAIPMTKISDLLEQYPELNNRERKRRGYIYQQKTMDEAEISSIKPIDEIKNNKNEKSEQLKMISDDNIDISLIIEKTTNDVEKSIIKFISKDVKHIDNIADSLGMNSSELSTSLCVLEMMGLIEQLPGRCYRIKR